MAYKLLVKLFCGDFEKIGAKFEINNLVIFTKFSFVWNDNILLKTKFIENVLGKYNWKF